MKGLERRTAIAGLLGVAGAGLSLRWARGGEFGESSPASMSDVADAALPAREAGRGQVRALSIAQVPLGGGGFVTGIDISTDGQRFVCRTDVANAYVRERQGGSWQPLFSPGTMLQADYDSLPAINGKADGQGVAGIRMAPSNKDVIYASYHGYIWKSEDGGRTIRRTRLRHLTMPANSGLQRLFNRTIDVHPTDPLQVIVGTHGDGAWFSVDGGIEWRQLALPASSKSADNQPGIILVLFDPSAPDRVYVFVTGLGLLASNEGLTGRFSALPGGPIRCSSLVAGPNGTIFLCETKTDFTGRVWIYSPKGGWEVSKSDYEAQVLAIDRREPNRVVTSNPDGIFMRSDDGGRSFRSMGLSDWQRRTGEVGWIRANTRVFPAEMLFDPAASGQLWIGQGVGVAHTDVTTPPYQLTDWSAGIEELCAVGTLSVPGGSTILSAWDKPFWRLDNQASYANDFRYPVARGTSHQPDLVAFGSYVDYAADNPQILVGVVAPSKDATPGISTDGGRSWQGFEGTPSTGWGYGGCIAASTAKNFVLLPSNNAIGVFTVDGGKNWSPVRLDGKKPTARFSNAYYVARKNISADKSRPGTFALVYTVIANDSYSEPLGGVWLTKDGGRSWTQTLRGVISQGSHDPDVVRRLGLDPRQFWRCQLDYVPGRPGELVYTPHADFADDRFYWSKNDGQNWAELHRSIRNVSCFGFGKALPGQAYPAVYFWGKVDGYTGLFASLDWFRTGPLLLTRFPSRMLATVVTIGGDPDRFGRVLVGTSCAGWVQIDAHFA